ncbi:branched-chain amino acid aminotransferase [Nocardiopsis lambiniae]|uniref:branched-chain-amino-acid transaminase n=1 Tax=Nocardiopsis lambiniae TaxID=3075539 RepID=A0ABU2M7G1_9ACTN|nr:branched-chain amino acid aminotransferase [Nocardiopsis sp. DSM 44743]MDT0328085.1 branched-chain amino acid aminotransferase [Nocardiopsis sp. DSM 44743]
MTATASNAYGSSFTAHMVLARWTEEDGWSRPATLPFGELPMHPAMVGLHYGQVVFEGLKAFRGRDGGLALFRPEENARRFRHSARRLAMPELPDDLFLDAAEELVARDGHVLGDGDARSLYLRPLMYASEPDLMLRPAREYTFLLIAFVTGGLFGDADAISVWVSHDQSRAMPGGTGDIKCAGNYAPTYLAQNRALEQGCQQVVWLDSEERRWIEEAGAMSLFFVRGGPDGARVVTPELTGTLLPSVTRASVLDLAADLGHTPVVERVSLEQWRKECETGEMTEAFSCGTAAVITPVTRVRDAGGDWVVGDGAPGPVTRSLRSALVDVQHGRRPDPRGWLHAVAAR